MFKYLILIKNLKLKIKNLFSPLSLSLFLAVFGALFVFLTNYASVASAAPWPQHYSEWGKRKQLTLVNNSGQTLNQNTTYQINVDTKTLAKTGDVLASCDDLRIVYQPSSTTATEISRSYALAQGATDCKNSSSTVISFPLQSSILNSQSSGDYYLYYANPSSPSYPSPPLSSYDTNPGSASFVAPFNNSTTAIASGSATPTTATGAIRYSGGKSALSFDGVGDYVDVGNISSLNISGNYTLGAWVKRGSNSAVGTILHKGAGGNSGYTIAIGENPCTTNQVKVTKFGVVDICVGSFPTDTNWHHMVEVINSDNSLTLYIDGASNGSSSNTSSFIAPTSLSFLVGHGETHFNGSIDEVTVWNRALTTGDILSLYTKRAPVIRDSNTKLLLHFDENGDDPRNTGKALDDSGNGNHGTITGAKYVGGLIGVDDSNGSNPSALSPQPSQSYSSHQGIFIEEGTTNKITNPSFENGTYDTNWSSQAQPDSVAGLKLWLKADSLSLNDNDVVSTWTDSSGNGKDATQSTGGIQPVYKANILNSKPVVRFSSDYMTLSKPTSGTSGTLFAVATLDNSTGYNIYDTNDDGWWRFGDGGSYLDVFRAHRTNNWQIGMPTNGTYVFSITSSSSNYELFKNSVSQGTYAADFSNGAATHYIGVSNRLLGYLTGDIAEIVMYDNELSTSNRQRVESYLAAKYALTNNLTATSNTTTPYVKFGSTSTKIVASADGNYVTTLNPGNTNMNTLSVYVNNSGATVDATVAKLVWEGAAVTTTYTDMGGGWWRLSYSSNTSNSSNSYGIQVMAGKTVYVDGFQLEEKAYATTYADGTLGTGYAWTGTANNSTSTRAAGSLQYATASNVNANTGTVSLWVKFDTASSVVESNGPIFSVGDATNYIELFRGRNGNANELALRTSGGHLGQYTATWTAGAWNLFVITWDTSTVSLFQNSSQLTAYFGTASRGPTSLTGNILLDQNANSTSNSILRGKVISDLRIFDRALSSDQVSQLYYAGLGSHSEGTTINRFSQPEDPVAYWKLDEGTGTTASNAAPPIQTPSTPSSPESTSSSLNGTISGAAWQSEDLCLTGKCLKFDGTDDVVTVSNTPSSTINSVSLWVKPISVSGTIYLSALSASSYLSAVNGTVTTTGFTSPTIYVNGKQSSNLTIEQWNHVEVTTATGITASAITIGKANSAYLNGFIDDVKLFNYVRTAAQVKADYNDKLARGSVIASEAKQSLSNGLVGYWKMDETSGNAADSSGNSNTGTWAGTGSHYTAGKFGNGGGFNGTDDDIELNQGTLPINTVSVGAWIKTSTSGTTQTVTMLGDDSGNQRIWRIQVNNSGKAYVESHETGQNTITGTTTINNDVWHHVLFTKTGANGTLSLYVDGNLEGTSTIGNVWSSGGKLLTIGSANINCCSLNQRLSFFSGNIDEVRIYNRALSPAEVRQLYNFAPGPVGYWKFDESSGTSVSDSSGNQNTGTWSGTGTHWTQGKFGKAGKFNGTDDKTTISSNPIHNLQSFTVSSWIYPNVNTCSGSYCTAIGLEGDDAIIDINSSGNIRANLFGIGTITATGNFSNGWHYVSLTKNGTSVTLYVDGVQKASTSGTVTWEGGGIHFGVNYNSSFYFPGSIDDVKIYNYARTPDQIMEDMTGRAAPVSLQGVISGGGKNAPLIYLKMDEGTGNPKDSSGNGKNGTLNDGATWSQNGKFGRGVSFDGTNDDVSISDFAY